jgi:hypothetical protein
MNRDPRTQPLHWDWPQGPRTLRPLGSDNNMMMVRCGIFACNMGMSMVIPMLRV